MSLRGLARAAPAKTRTQALGPTEGRRSPKPSGARSNRAEPADAV